MPRKINPGIKYPLKIYPEIKPGKNTLQIKFGDLILEINPEKFTGKIYWENNTGLFGAEIKSPQETGYILGYFLRVNFGVKNSGERW